MNIIPGSYKIIAIELFSDFNDDLVFEMGSIAVELNLYENMFENCITGNMIFNDSRNVYGNLPILGYETVNINYSVSVLDPNNNSVTTEEFEQSYKIYSISDYQKENPTVSAYAVNFISEKYFTDITTTISKSYVGQPISGIVNSILVNDLKLDADEINIEDTLPQQNLIIPNWRPFEALNWLANRAISETYKGASYVFFQDKDKYNFVSLESLFNGIEDSNITRYRQLIRGMGTPDPYIIKSIDFDQSIDISENITSGMYANKIIEHDIVKRSFTINEFDYVDSYDTYKHMNNGKLDLTDNNSYSKKYDSKIMYVPKHTKKYNNLNYSDSVQTSLPIRISQLQQLNNFAVTIIVAGDTTKTIGDVVDLRVVSPEPSGVRDIWDPVYSGKYLIVSLKHTIDVSKYNTTITAVKDTYQDNLEDTVILDSIPSLPIATA